MIQTTNLALMQTLYGQNALLVYVYFLFVYCVYNLGTKLPFMIQIIYFQN